MRPLNRKQVSVLLTVLAVLLWSQSILYARFEVGYFGLIHSLPITFFIALAFLTAASATLWTSTENHSKLLCLQLVILIAILWLAPEVTGGSPPFDDHAYRSLGLIEYIAEQGHFSSSEISYLSWPGAFILSTILAEALSVNFEPVLGFFPLFMQLLYLLPLYIFLKNTLGQNQSNYCWAGAWLFYLASWQGNEYFSSAPGVGLFLLLILLALVTMPSIWERSTQGFALLLLMVVAFTALAITHLLTALAALSIMAALTLVKKSKRMAPVIALCLVLLVFWNLTGVERHTILTIPTTAVLLPGETIEVPGETIEVPGETIEVPRKPPIVGGRPIVLAPDVFVKTEIISHLSGSESHIAVTKTRLLFSAMFAMIGIIGAVLACLTRRRRDVAIFVLAMALAPLILIVIPYAGRLVNYLFVFLLAPMAYFGARLLDIKKKAIVLVFCLFLVVSLPLHLIAHYGNQAVDYRPQSQVSGLLFYYDKTTIQPVHRFSMDFPKYPLIAVGQLQWQDHMVLPEGGFKEDSPCWLYIHRRHKAFYDFIYGAPLFIGKIEDALSDSRNSSLVYYNPDFRLYFLEPAVLP